MIMLIEPICKKWEHEEFNAGLLRLVDCTAKGDEKIVYYGVDDQIRAVSEIYNSDRIKFKSIHKIPSSKVADCKSSFPVYVKILDRAVLECRPKTVIITAGTRPCMMAASILAKMNPKINFFMALHGIFDPKLGKIDSCIRIMKKSLKNENMKWIVYSYYAEHYLKDNGIKRVFFLHLPYASDNINNRRNALHPKRKYQIGIIGSCANDNAFRLVEAVGRTEGIADKFEFWILSWKSKNFRGCKNVKILQPQFTRKDKEKCIRQTDYLLLPYGKTEYQTATSGVLFDAIANRVPCLAYDSPCLSYYQERYNVGIQKKSLNEMLEALKAIAEDKTTEEKYFINIEEIEKENRKVIKEILAE